MSWSTTPTLPQRAHGPAWTTTATAPARAVGPSWFTTLAERVATLHGTGTLSMAITVIKPDKGSAFTGNGRLSATVRPVIPIAAVFSAGGELAPHPAQLSIRAVDFAASGSLAAVINDGLSAIVIGGTPATDGLTAIISGGLFDGLSATVTPVAGASAAVAASFSGAGNLSTTMLGYENAQGFLTATVGKGIAAAFSGSGALSATVTAVAAGAIAAAFASSGSLSATITPIVPVAAPLSGTGSLTATMIGYQNAEGFLTATVTAGVVTSQPVSAPLTATGSLTATVTSGLISQPVSASFTADSALTATGYTSFSSAAALSGAGSMSATVLGKYLMSAALSGSGTLSATVVRAPIAFGAVGAGTTSTTTPSWTHTKATADNCVIVAAMFYGSPADSAALASWTRSATYGGTAMTNIGFIDIGTTGGYRMWIEMWRLLSPASGAKTVAVTVTRSGGGLLVINANSASYSNVASVASAASANGVGTALSQTVTSAAGRRIVHAFCGDYDPISAYNRTQRSTLGGGGAGFILGDAAGAASVSFTGTQGTSGNWGSIACNLS